MSTSQLNEALLDACANPDTTLSQVEELIEAAINLQ
jgi:hypothetical protein